MNPQDITVSEHDLAMIKKRVGYPIADSIDLLLNDDEIKLYCVTEALRDYFRWFPKKYEYQETVTGSFTVDFPDDFTYGVIDSRLRPFSQNYSSGSLTGNRLSDIIIASRYSSRSGKMGYYGTRYRFGGLNRAGSMSDMVANAEYTKAEALRTRVDVEDKQVKGYANVNSTLTIVFAKYSYNMNDVKFEHLDEVLRLSSAKIMKHIADTLGMVDLPNLAVEVNYDTINDKADEIESSIIEKWEAYPKIHVITQGKGLAT